MRRMHPETSSQKSAQRKSVDSKQADSNNRVFREQAPHQEVLDSLVNRILTEPEPAHTSEVNTQRSANPIHQEVGELPHDKNYFRVRDVAAILKVGPHVLRFWETQFSMVRPTKSRSGQRVYRRKDVEVLLRVRELVYVEKLPIKKAREILLQERRDRKNLTGSKASSVSTLSDPSLHAAQSEAQAERSGSITPDASHSTRLNLLELLVDLRNLKTLCEIDPFGFKARQIR